MGVGISGDAPVSNEGTGTDEAEEDNEDDDELTVHHTASAGDVQVCLLFKDCLHHLCYKMLFILNKKDLHFVNCKLLGATHKEKMGSEWERDGVLGGSSRFWFLL